MVSSTPVDAPVVRMLGTVLIGEQRPGSRKQAGVLAALAFQARTSVSIDTLAQRVWGSRLPPSPRQALYSYLAKLRQQLSPFDVSIDRDGGGYRLDIDPSRVDLHLSRRLAGEGAGHSAAGEVVRAAAAYAAALELWRGDPLTGVTGDWAQGQRAALEREHLLLRKKWFDAELACGRHAGLLDELARLTSQHPLDETLARLYMLALYRDGQPNLALACFRDIRERLIEELGSEPERALSELHTRILRDAPVPAGPPVAEPAHPLPRQLPAAIGTFTARAKALDELTGHLAEIESSSSPPPVLAIVGTGGIGKTTLVTHWAHTVAERFPDGQLFVDLRGYSLARPLTPEQALERLLRALGVGHDRMPAELDEKSALYRSILAGKRALIVLDNVGTAQQARPLLPAAASCLAVVTSRSSLPGLHVDNDVRALTLNTLTQRESVELLVRIIGRERAGVDGAEVSELARLCGGFPLALRLAAARIVSGGSVAEFLRLLRADDRLSALAVRGDPATALASTFDVSYRELDAPARRVFHMVGTHPADVADSGALAAMAELPPADTRAALERLAEVHLVSAVSEDYWGTHDLVREHAGERARQSLSPKELRDGVERGLDWYIAATRQATTTAFNTTLKLTGNRAEPAAPVPDFGGFEAAIAWLDGRQATLIAAVHGAEAAGLRRHASSLPALLTTYFETRRQYQDWLDTCGVGLRAAEALDDPMRISAMRFKLGNVSRRTNRPDLALEHYRESLAAANRTGDPYVEAIPRSCLANLYKDTGDFAEAARQLEPTLSPLREADDMTNLVLTHCDLGFIATLLGDYRLARTRLTEGLELARDRRLRIGLTLATENLARLDYREHDYELAAVRFGEAVDGYEALHDPEHAETTRSRLAIVAGRRGRHAEALALHHKALTVLDRAQLRAGLAAGVLNNAGISFTDAGEPGKALEYHREAGQRAANSRYESARAHHGIGLALRALKRDGADEHLDTALKLYTRMGTAEAAEPGMPLY